MCINDYGIKRKIISTQNPQANAIVKCAHQMLRNLIRSFELQDNPYLDLDDPWSGILAAALSICNVLNVSYHSSRDCNAWPAHIWEGYDT